MKPSNFNIVFDREKDGEGIKKRFLNDCKNFKENLTGLAVLYGIGFLLTGSLSLYLFFVMKEKGNEGASIFLNTFFPVFLLLFFIFCCDIRYRIRIGKNMGRWATFSDFRRMYEEFQEKEGWMWLFCSTEAFRKYSNYENLIVLTDDKNEVLSACVSSDNEIEVEYADENHDVRSVTLWYDKVVRNTAIQGSVFQVKDGEFVVTCKYKK